MTGLLDTPGEYWLDFECCEVGVYLDMTDEKMRDERWMGNLRRRLAEFKCKGYTWVRPPSTPRREK